MDEPEPPVSVEDAQRLVGAFMFNWAGVEAHLDNAIQKMLKIDNLAMAILSFHLNMDAKVFVARCAVDTFGPLPKEWQKASQKVLMEVADLNTIRNIIAHNGFGPTEDGKAVEFFRIHARSALSFPDEIWPRPRFGESVTNMHHLSDRLDEITSVVVANRERIERINNKVPEDYLSRLLRYGQSLSSTIDQTNPESHPPHPQGTEGE